MLLRVVLTAREDPQPDRDRDRADDQERPDLLRVPRGEGDHDVPREALLEKLERLRIGMRGSVLAGLRAGMGVDHDPGPVRLARDGGLGV